MDLTAKLQASFPPSLGGSQKEVLKRLLRIMKISAVLIFAACMQVSAKVNSQNVTLSVKNEPLDRVFTEIKKQTGYTFMYTETILKEAKKVSIDVKNRTLEETLAICFSEQPFTYKIIEKTIVVQPKEAITAQKVLQSFFPPPPIDVRGKVVNENGEPVAGASVKVKGSNVGTTTDVNGEFVLNGIDDKATLVFTGTNIEGFEQKVNGKSDLAITLKTKVNKLDEVQIIAYGTTTKRFNTSNISTIKTEDLEKQSVNNPLLALSGRVPGLFITQSNGLPGSAVTVRIQGQNSIGKGNDPLYVIDGVPFSSQLLPSIGNILGLGSAVNGIGTTGNPFSYINPSDIESIEILKDADATAIYGSRAANGAILITTKKGKAGRTKVDINMQSGWGQVTRKLDLMNTQQYVQMRKEALKNDGISSPSAIDYDINGTWDTTRSTDWQKELIGRTVHYTDIQATISGGNALTQYLIGGGYHKETSVFPGDFTDVKGSVHFNINNISSNQKFRVQFSGSYLVDNNRLPQSDLTSMAITLPPDAPSLYNPDGSLNWANNVSGNSTWIGGMHPLFNLLNTYSNKTNNLISNANLSYQILPGLELKSSLGYTNMQSKEIIINPLIGWAPELRQFNSRFGSFGNSNINSWIIEPHALYKRVIGKGKLDALVGTTIQQNNSNLEHFAGTGYNSDQVIGDIRSASSVIVTSTLASIYKYNALFARFNYNLQDKYILNLTGRRDGSSRFGAKNQFHNFGSAGVAWIFSNEHFVQNTLPFLSFGKIKGSYGTTGNDQIGDYQFLNQYNPTSAGAGIPYQGTTGLTPTGLTNPYIAWEETEKLQSGIDLGFFKDRIQLNASYFHNRSSNQLLAFNLPITTGFGEVTSNFPATVQNTGWEFFLTTINFKTKSFSWITNLNLTIPQNKLIDFPNLATSTYFDLLVVGQAITLRKVFHFLGVDPATGVYSFADKDGKATSSPNFSTDRTVLINTSPTFYGGLQNNISFKGFELDFLFQFVKQKAQNYFFGARAGRRNVNQPLYVLDRWQTPGDITSIQRYYSGSNLNAAYLNTSRSDAGVTDASYIRLKTMSLSWRMAERLRRKLHLQNCKLYMQGQNLLTITNYKGSDPETTSSGTLSPLRLLVAGIQITF